MDLGATNVRALLTDGSGRIRAQSRRSHRNDGPGPVLNVVVRTIEEALEGSPPPRGTVGLSVAAQVDPARGLVVHAPNLRWRHVPVGARLGARLRRPVRVVNDARAATYAEWALGAGKSSDDLFCLVVGTGVGGSAVVGGRLVDGAYHAAGEVGHLVMAPRGRKCTCPGRGCFEAYVGGWAIARRAREAVRADPSAGRDLIARAGSVARLRAETVFAAARAGDPIARTLTGMTEEYFANGVVSIANAFNPERIVVTGAVVRGWPRLVRAARQAVRARCQPPAARAQVVLGQLGDSAAAIGAALMARAPG